MAVLLGQTEPRAGAIRVAGAQPARDAQLRCRIAGSTWSPALAGFGKLRDWLGLSGAGEAERAGLQESLTDLMGRSMRSLSLAERRRVELSLALAIPQPCLMVLQEPFAVSGVDRKALIRTLSQRAASGCCVVVVGARLDELQGLGSCLGTLERGQLQPIGATRLSLRVTLADPEGRQAMALATQVSNAMGASLLAVSVERQDKLSHVMVSASDYRQACQAVQAACVAEKSSVLMIASQPMPLREAQRVWAEQPWASSEQAGPSFGEAPPAELGVLAAAVTEEQEPGSVVPPDAATADEEVSP